MSEAAIFTYCRPKKTVLKERCEILLRRCVALALTLLLVRVCVFYLDACLLYCVLWVPTIRLVMAVLKRAKLLSDESAFRFTSLGCYLLIPALIVLAGSINNNHPQIKRLSVEIPRKSSSINQLKIIYASDFHLGSNDYPILDRFIDKVNSADPDIILLGGDFLGGRGDPDLTKLTKQFRKLRARYGVYAVLGNHDLRRIGRHNVPWIGQDFFAESGMKLLEDDVEKIDGAFYLAGRNCEWPRKPIAELLTDIPDDLPVILLDHYPPDLKEVRQGRVNLQLSGHTHNGQLFPLNVLFVPLEYKFAYGVRRERDSLYLISSGVHYSTPPVNTQGYSEILLINAVLNNTCASPIVSRIFKAVIGSPFPKEIGCMPG